MDGWTNGWTVSTWCWIKLQYIQGCENA